MAAVPRGLTVLGRGRATSPDPFMVIYLRHPVHGTKVAISHLEVEYDEREGWERFDPSDPAEAAPVVNELAPKRRGRPPKNEG